MFYTQICQFKERNTQRQDILALNEVNYLDPAYGNYKVSVGSISWKWHILLTWQKQKTGPSIS